MIKVKKIKVGIVDVLKASINVLGIEVLDLDAVRIS
jgi:hypothetical protein